MEAARKHARPARMLRSVLIAAAGAGLWMVLSASAATADSGNSLLDGLRSTASSVTGAASSATSTAGDAVGVVAGALDSAPVVPKITNVTQPVANQMTELAPVLEPVASAATQLTETVDSSLGGTVSAVVGLAEPALDAVVAPLVQDVVAPIVKPATDAIAGLAPEVIVPQILEPAMPDVTGELLDAAFLKDASDTQPGVLAKETSGPASTIAASARPTWTPVLGGIQRWPATTRDTGQDGRGIPDGNSPASPPSQPGNAAGTGAGNGPAGGSAASAAWLHGGIVMPPLAEYVLTAASAQHLPAPVSFDPGSSPD